MMSPPTGKCVRVLFCAAITAGVSLTAAIPKDTNPKPDFALLPSGQRLTPLAAPGAQLEYLEVRHRPQLIANGAMTMAVSPDGKTLLVLLSFPVPDKPALARLSAVVAENNFLTAQPRRKDQVMMAALRHRIKHVIYVIKENRTYDQILGDLDPGNGDPQLTEFGEKNTPNFHHLAQQFVDLDNFFDSGDVSGDGWLWSTAGREPDFARRLVPLFYAGQGATYEFEGTNRNVNVGWATLQQRRRANKLTPCDPDLLPGTADVAALDGPQGTGAEKGYLWDAALRAGLTIRNYGCLCDLTRYEKDAKQYQIPSLLYPAKDNCRVAFPTKSALTENTDPFFSGFDNAYPDYYREWEREFDRFTKNGRLPTLEFVRLMHDHMGNMDIAIDGLRTPELQQADNDYAVGRLVEKVAHSRYKSDTLIFIVEDDAQDGADHVDAHRSTTYIVGPYVRHRRVVPHFYTTVSLLRTIEDILGLQHLNIYTATQSPMTDVFDLHQREWTFNAVPSLFLYNSQLPIPRCEIPQTQIPRPTHDSAYWAEKTVEFDFSEEDHLGDPAKFNRVIWEGLKGNAPYPSERNGADLRKDRRQILQEAESIPKSACRAANTFLNIGAMCPNQTSTGWIWPTSRMSKSLMMSGIEREPR
jgi:hypothetical protein